MSASCNGASRRTSGEGHVSDGRQDELPAAGRASRSRRVLGTIVRSGTLTLAVLDAARIAVSFLAVLLLRFDGNVPAAHWERFGKFVPIVIAVQLVANWRFRLYEQVWRHASVDEAVRVVGAAGSSIVVLLGVDLLLQPRVPVSVVVFGAVATMLFTGVSRFQPRILAAVSRDRRVIDGAPVAILGAGDTAAIVIRSLRGDDRGAMSPVVVLSDDASQIGHSLLGVPVAGTIEDLPRIAGEQRIAYALLAPSEQSRELTRRAADAAESANLALKIVPNISQMLANGSIGRIMRDVRIEDLLGREQVSTDLAAVSATITGRRVLVTGGGGSIGSEIVRQVAALSPASLLVLDHDETHLFDVAESLSAPCVQLLADIRDPDSVRAIFETHRPDVVFHAAAHKHVPLLEAHPSEAVRTNVEGTLNVLTAAVASGVARLVFISTDKAVDPSSIMGSSKWAGERLVATLAPAGSRWCSVRFGNVLGSRGSVLPTFTRQIESGGPVTVTDPDMTRYFMSTEEAVQLVLQAAALAEGTDVFMLEMGEPVNILGLARKMIRLSGLRPGTDIAIEITGARPGEKLTEALSWQAETAVATAHGAITRLEGTAIDTAHFSSIIEKLVDLAAQRDDAAVAPLLRELPAATMMSASQDVDETVEQTWSSAST